jgi:predicted DNA-binding ribbon-helix-helix protein
LAVAETSTAPLESRGMAGMTASRQAGEIAKRSVAIDGHRTSVSLEQAFWEALREIAAADGRTVNALIAEIDRERHGNLSSSIRVFVLDHVRRRAA